MFYLHNNLFNYPQLKIKDKKGKCDFIFIKRMHNNYLCIPPKTVIVFT